MPPPIPQHKAEPPLRSVVEMEGIKVISPYPTPSHLSMQQELFTPQGAVLPPQPPLVELLTAHDAVVLYPPPHSTPVGGRLAHHMEAWKTITSSSWILNTVEHGLRVHFTGRPFQHHLPPETIGNADVATITEEITASLEKQAIEPAPVCPPASFPMFYHPHFTVPKKDVGKFRHVIDMHRGNRFTQTHHFKMEGLHSLKDVLHRHDWLTKLDVKDAFLHIPIHVAHRDFFRFRWKRRHFRFKVMPFGYCDSPRIFTKVMKCVMETLRQRGVRCVAYLDDILIIASSREESLQHTQMTVDLLHSLGFSINREKSVVVPSQSQEFLGFLVNSTDMTLSLPAKKLRDLRHLVRSTLRKNENGKDLSPRELARVVGQLHATHPAFLPAPIMLRTLRACYLRYVRTVGWDHKCISLGEEEVTDLQWWETHLSTWSGRQIASPPPTLYVTTDASHTGWGGWISSIAEPDRVISEIWGFWSKQEAARSSNWREGQATLLTLSHMTEHLKGHSVRIRSDNLSNVFNLIKGGGSSQTLSKITRRVWELCLQQNISLSAEHVPGSRNIRADWLSRLRYGNVSQQLPHEIFRSLTTIWGMPQIDLFASKLDARLPRYFSLLPDPESCGTDAFAQIWTMQLAYAFPPPALIGRMLQKVRAEGATVIAVVPLWKTAVWFPELLILLADDPVVLPPLPGYQDNRSRDIQTWNVCACLLSGQPSKRMDYHSLLLSRRSMRSDLPQPATTTTTGTGLSDTCNHTMWEWVQWRQHQHM